MASLLLINGPNLNLLGKREPGVYGATSLADVEARLGELAAELGHELAAFQSNAEHEIVDHIQKAQADQVDFILLNPGAFTHTSIAMRDALLAVNIPFIEMAFTHRSKEETMTPSEVFEFAKKHNAEMLDMKFVDLLGSWQQGDPRRLRHAGSR